MSKQVWLNGKLVPEDHATVSVFDHGLLYGDGVFEGIRSYNGRIFKLRSHLKRLYNSAKAIRLVIPQTPEQLEQAVRDTVAANGTENGYVRLCVTRGVGTLGLNPFVCNSASTFIIADSIELYPQQLYDNGLELIIASTIRTPPAALSPGIKSMNYLNNILAKIEAMDAGVLEAVMLNYHGFVAECTGDNIFIVRPHEGRPQLVSPPPEAGVLEGVTMNVVIDLAAHAGIDATRANLTKYDLYSSDEMFLTGTAAEIVPVTKVDQRPVGSGKPGPVTRQLMAAFKDLLANHAPED